MASEGAGRLLPFNKTIREAVDFYVAHLEARAASKPLDKFVEQFQAEMEIRVANGGLRAGTLKVIKNTFVKLTERFGSTLFSDISEADLKDWLNKRSDRRLDRLRDIVETKAGLKPWKANWLRDSFISYLYVVKQDESYVAAQAGNSPKMVHRNYRALVTRADAKKYWAIRPKGLTVQAN
jgi:hypothetical protein